jgi:AraC-like DNA-binding protein
MSLSLAPSTSLETFLRDPVGRYVVAGTSLLWAATPSLAGVVAYGRPGPVQSRAALAAYEALFSPVMANSVDVILDARRLDIDTDALSVFLAWVRTHLPRFQRRVRLQVGVVEDNLPGVILCGIVPMLGAAYPFRVVTSPTEALRLVDGDPALAPHLDDLATTAAGVPALVGRLRHHLRSRRGDLDLATAALALGVSVRSLQRGLKDCGSSFVQEQRAARWEAARQLLGGTQDKVGAVAHRLGISERTLTRLVREEGGCTPDDFRRHARAP